jgi:predicted acylesterase/phospholipase RssA
MLLRGGAVWRSLFLALPVSLSSTQFTVLKSFVGTSAGAVVGACLANGITPEELILANLGHKQATIPGMGADEIISKDASVDELLAAIRVLLRGRG